MAPATEAAGPRRRRVGPSTLAGALWATLAVKVVRRRLKRRGLAAKIPFPPRLGPGAERGVRAALRRLSPTCLERALVEQAWLAAAGRPRDVIIGLPPGGMKDGPAHAWVDGTDPAASAHYLELHRLAPPVRDRAPR